MQPEYVRFRVVMLASLTLLSTTSCRRGTPVAEIRDIPAAENTAAGPATALPTLDEADWPWWRGPSCDGVATGPAPTEWTATKNVVWKSKVPGRGHSSPTIWGQ